MNYTQNYHLPQWEKTDRIVMEDFNQMCAGIDSGIREAKTAADTAQAAAEEAKSTAKTALSNKNYVTGTYNGSVSSQEIHLGFKPSAVIICRAQAGTADVSSAGICSLHVEDGSFIRFKDYGFVLSAQTLNDRPTVNWQRFHYAYIAFR